MAYLLQSLFGERSLTKVVGVFAHQADALTAASAALEEFSKDQIKLLGPQQAESSRNTLLGRSMEPEQRGIFRTLMRAHAVTGTLGAAFGVALYAGLYASQNAAVLGSPSLSFAAIVGFATTFGLLVGGLVALRPDHIELISQVRKELAAGNWVVVIHPTTPDQSSRAKDHLARHAGKVLSSL